MQPPRLAHDPVNRRGLRARLRESDACLALVVAPAGYGKTTLLAQWALDDPRPVGWIALTESDNDPPALLAHFLLALEAACAVDDEQYRAIALSPADIASVVLPRFGAVVGDAPPMIWMLDDTHLLSSARSLEVLRVLCEHLSPGSAIVLSGRRAPDVPIARWRASRWVLDVVYDDLTMTPTEGWPAGIYLSALTDRFDLDVDPVSASDGDGAIAAYLSEEVLRAFDDSDTDFLLRSAVLDDLTPATCDAVLGTVDAGARLDRFAATNSFVRRVGPDVYRYHQLFRDLLLAELRRREPGAARELHHRASEVLADAGDLEGAVAHAHAAGDEALATSLIWRATTYVGTGRSATITRWLQAFAPATIAASPDLAMAAAWATFTEGDPAESARWATLLHAHDESAQLADGTVLGPLLALVDALMGREGAGRTLRDAQRAYDDLPAISPYRALACAVAAVAARLAGDAERAQVMAREGVERGMIFRRRTRTAWR